MHLRIKLKLCVKRGWGTTAILILWCISGLVVSVFAQENQYPHEATNTLSYIQFPNPIIDEPNENSPQVVLSSYSNPQNPLQRHRVLRNLSSDLLAYYPFNGNAHDESGEGNHGTVNGPSLVVDRFGNPTGAYSFDGVDDYIDLPNFSTPHYTVSLWVKANETGQLGGKVDVLGSGRFIDGWSDGEILDVAYYQLFNGDPREYYIGYTTPGNYLIGSFHPYKDGADKTLFKEQRLFHSTNLADGAWHSLIISFDGILASLYLDGKRVNSLVFDASIATETTQVDESSLLEIIDLGIGRSKRHNTYTTGVIDDVRFYKRALSDQEIQNLYYQESGLVAYYPFNGNSQDESGRNNHGTLHGATLVTDRFGNPEGAPNFDGVDDYIELPNSTDFNFEEVMTLSIWLKPTYKSTDNPNSPEAWMYPIKKATHGATEASWLVSIDNYNELYEVSLYTETTETKGVAIQNPITDLPEDSFSHLVMTYNGQALVYYLNGEKKASQTVSGAIKNSENAKIVSHMLNRYYQGQIDDLRFYNRALSEAEVQNLHHEESIAPWAPLTDVIQLSNGYHHSCALLADGTVKCWGHGLWGQLGNGTTNSTHTPVLVEGISTATQISAGAWYTCALLSDQSVKCWGYGHHGQLGDGVDYRDFGYSTTPVTVKNLSGVVQISTSLYHTCALLEDETLKCWGDGEQGQLGTASNYSTIPVTINGVTNVAQVTTGSHHTCVLLTDGTVQCWGKSFYGELGNGEKSGQSTTPIAVEGISNAIQISASNSHTCVLLETKKMACWGRGLEGQIGIDSTEDALRPVEVSSLSNVEGITTGPYTTCALMELGDIYCWGEGSYGQLGNGNNLDQSLPNQVQNISNAKQVSSGNLHTCVLLQDATVYCWGAQRSGRLGNGQRSGSNTPVIVQGIVKAKQVSSGGYHACATLNNGFLECWGSNTYGQLGDNSQIYQQTPKRLSNLSNISQISAGKYHTCALLNDQSVQCWGDNREGQLGNGTNETFLVPVTTQSISNGQQLSGGNHHTCLLLTDSTVQCWGRGTQGQLGNGQTSSTNVPVSVNGLAGVTQIDSGEFHTCVLLNDNTVQCWGGNDFGQLGNGSTNQSLSPVSINNLTNVKQVVAGDYHSCAVSHSGGVQCWGSNEFGQLGSGVQGKSTAPVTIVGLSNVIQISTGSAHTCALLVDGRVTCWGKRYLSDDESIFEILNSPQEIQGVTQAIQIASGHAHSCALLETGSVQCWGLGNTGALGDGNAWSTTPSRVKLPEYGVTINPKWNTTIVAGESINFSAHAFGGTGNLQYIWNFGGNIASIPVEDPGDIVFSEAGVYSVTLTVEDQEGRQATDTRRITVVPEKSAGNLILVAGGGLSSNNYLKEATQYLSNLAYQTFLKRSLDRDDIFYFNPATEHDIDGDGEFDPIVDSSEMTVDALEAAIVEWAVQQPSDGPLYLYLNDHGGYDGFRVYTHEILRSSDLGSYLDIFQAATQRSVVVIIEACKSGTFIDDLAAPNRLVITSANNYDSYVSPSGDISFSQPFFTELFAGASFKKAFDYAANALKTYGRPFNQQEPMFEGNGDLASSRLGENFIPSNFLPGIADYTQSSQIQANTEVPLFVKVTALDPIQEVTAVITPPDFVPPSLSADFSSPQFTLPVVSLLDEKDGHLDGTYEGNYTFTTNGRHQIIFTVRDQNNHVVSSPPIDIEVSGGTDPNVWQLVSYSEDNALSLDQFFDAEEKSMIRTVWRWQNQQWSIWSPTHSIEQLNTEWGGTDFKELTQLQPGQGYWVNSKSYLPLSTSEGSPFIQELHRGWNLVGFPKEQEGPVTRYLEQNPEIESIWSWGNNEWYVHFKNPITHPYSELSQVQAGVGYWVKVR